MWCTVCQNKDATEKYHKYAWNYYWCLVCNSLFLSPIPKATYLKNIYQHFTYSTGFLNEREIRKNARSLIECCQKLNPHSETLLDIGAGAGFLLNEAQIKGLSVIGIEPSEKLVTYGQNNFGVPIHCSRLTKALVKVLPHKFDIVILSHVIEHICEPQAFLNLVLDCLAPNGVLAIETPNFDSWLSQMEGEDYTFLTPPEHVRLYSKQTFDELFKRLNVAVTVIAIATFSHRSHCKGIIKPVISVKYVDNIKQQNKPIMNQKTLAWKKVSHIFFDQFIARLLIPLVNIGNKGSILRLYIRKR